ncbi:MAG: alpha/beta fold hydrolase [Chloroflexota bacterium]
MTDPAPARGRPWVALGPRDAAAIVFVHGTRLTRAQWFPQLRRLSGRYRCIAVDLPGHGLRGGEPFTIEAAVEAIREAILVETAEGRAVVVGLSLGGFKAVEVAVAYPELVAGLVLAGCSGEAFGSRRLPFTTFATIMERVPGPLLEQVNRAFFRLRYGRATGGPIVEAGFWSGAGAVAVRLLVGRHFLDRLSMLWTPVLVINGALDPVFGPQGDYWAATCRRGRHAVIRHAMHLSNLDRPATFSRLVARFTDEVAADR